MNGSKNKFMELAIALSEKSVAEGGGPFGAVVVRRGEVVATGTNSVTLLNDPTAHAEVSAIRAACAAVKDFKLEECEIYSSCEPCPMCLSAIYWAGIRKIYSPIRARTPSGSASTIRLSTTRSRSPRRGGRFPPRR